MDQSNEQVRVDYGGWISGPCLSAEQMAAGNADQIMHHVYHGDLDEEDIDYYCPCSCANCSGCTGMTR